MGARAPGVWAAPGRRPFLSLAARAGFNVEGRAPRTQGLLPGAEGHPPARGPPESSSPPVSAADYWTIPDRRDGALGAVACGCAKAFLLPPSAIRAGSRPGQNKRPDIKMCPHGFDSHRSHKQRLGVAREFSPGPGK